MRAKKAILVTNAVGRAVIELKLRGSPISEFTIAEILEEFRLVEKKVVLKAIYRDAAEILRTGELPLI